MEKSPVPQVLARETASFSIFARDLHGTPANIPHIPSGVLRVRLQVCVLCMRRQRRACVVLLLVAVAGGGWLGTEAIIACPIIACPKAPSPKAGLS